MKTMLLLVTALLFLACSPQNDPTSKYDTKKYVPLEEKNFKTQYFLPQDAIRINIDSKSSKDWKEDQENTIIVHLVNNIKGLKNTELKVGVGQQEELPEWMNFKLIENKNNEKTYILKASPALRKGGDVSVSLYELVFRLSYDKEHSDPTSVEMLNFYRSQSSQQVNVEVGKF
ncbi:MAG: hypothetical protein H6625_12200 [Bdellovibrionaceae bacterium]|nr:hypothetical protein [Pseudobdellovibrionaceae bacterium]